MTTINDLDNFILCYLTNFLDIHAFYNFSQTCERHFNICKESFIKKDMLKKVWNLYVDIVFSCMDRDDHNVAKENEMLLETLFNLFIYKQKFIFNLRNELASKKPDKVIEILINFFKNAKYILSNKGIELLFPASICWIVSDLFEGLNNGFSVDENLSYFVGDIQITDFFYLSTKAYSEEVKTSNIVIKENLLNSCKRILQNVLPSVSSYSDSDIIEAFYILFGIPTNKINTNSEKMRTISKYEMKTLERYIRETLMNSNTSIKEKFSDLYCYLNVISIFHETTSIFNSFFLFQKILFEIASEFSYGEMLGYYDVSRMLLKTLQPLSLVQIKTKDVFEDGKIYTLKLEGKYRDTINVRIYKEEKIEINDKDLRSLLTEDCWFDNKGRKEYRLPINQELNEFFEKSFPFEHVACPLIMSRFTYRFFKLIASNIAFYEQHEDNKDIYCCSLLSDNK